MSVRVLDAVWRFGPKDQNSFILLLAIADNCNDQGTCFPSINTLADKCRCSTRSVMRGIQTLERARWLRVERDSIGGRGNKYIVNLEKLESLRHPQPHVTQSHVAKSRDKLSPEKKQSHVTQSHVTQRHMTNGHVTKTTRDTCQPVISPKPPIRSNRQLTTKPPLTPLHAGGSGNATLPPVGVPKHDHTDAALNHLATELGITNQRTLRKLLDPLRLWKRNNDATAYEAADAMIAAWQAYQAETPLRGIAKPWTVATFFTQGHWLKQHSWPTDPKLRRTVH